MRPVGWASSAARSQAALVPEMTILPGQSRLAISRTSPLPGLCAEGLDLHPLQPQDADHAAGRGVGGLLHGCPALLHQRQAVLEIHHAGEDHGRILAQAQAGGRFAGQHHVGRLGPQRFQGRQAGHEQGRLAVDRGVEFFGRALEAELGQIVAEHFGGAVVEPPGGGQRLGQTPAHAHGLRALPREEKGDLAHPIIALVFGVNDLAAHVMPAFRANRVWRHSRAALRTVHDVPGRLCIVAPGGCRCVHWNVCVLELPSVCSTSGVARGVGKTPGRSTLNWAKPPILDCSAGCVNGAAEAVVVQFARNNRGVKD